MPIEVLPREELLPTKGTWNLFQPIGVVPTDGFILPLVIVRLELFWTEGTFQQDNLMFSCNIPFHDLVVQERHAARRVWTLDSGTLSGSLFLLIRCQMACHVSPQASECCECPGANGTPANNSRAVIHIVMQCSVSSRANLYFHIIYSHAHITYSHVLITYSSTTKCIQSCNTYACLASCKCHIL